MLFLTCPYCAADYTTNFAKSGVWTIEACDECGKNMVIYHRTIKPDVLMLDEVIIDQKNKTIKVKDEEYHRKRVKELMIHLACKEYELLHGNEEHPRGILPTGNYIIGTSALTKMLLEEESE
jgi:hypothetical protein